MTEVEALLKIAQAINLFSAVFFGRVLLLLIYIIFKR